MTPTKVIGGAQRERLHGLDLLRTVAIFLVIAWHLPHSVYPFHWRPATWAGVDLFFVLSGYLIGSQLLRPYTNNLRPSYLDFFLRRAIRILPAYLVVLLIYFTIPEFREQPTISPFWKLLTFTQNLGLDAHTTGAFSHAWSLCVEEHFYLVLPIIVLWFMRRPSLMKAGLLTAAIVLFGLIVRSFLWMRYIAPIDPHGWQLGNEYLETIYYPTYTRLDGLLVGVLLAATKLFRPAWWTEITSHGNALLGAGILILTISFWICQNMFSLATAVVGYPLLATGFGLLVLSSLSKGSVLAKHRIIGATTGATLAYSTYLTHKEVMHLDQLYLGSVLPLKGIAGLLVYGFSFLVVANMLYFAIERPCMKLRDRVLGSRLKTFPATRAPRIAHTLATR
jgi:peptidoglycan/LPS O-acetylase OafA/YrhL